jgi:hypothetical protein
MSRSEQCASAGTVLNISDVLAKTEQVPNPVWVGSVPISPESYLLTLAQVMNCWNRRLYRLLDAAQSHSATVRAMLRKPGYDMSELRAAWLALARHYPATVGRAVVGGSRAVLRGAGPGAPLLSQFPRTINGNIQTRMVVRRIDSCIVASF